MDLTSQQIAVLEKVAAASVACENSTACPAALSAAQCLIESGWLARAPGNNCFGIKATDDSATYQITREYLDGTWHTLKLAFEAYPSLEACFEAHGRLIQGGRYSDAWRQYEQDHDLDNLIRGIGAIYATAPEYAEEVLALAHGPHVSAAIEDARASAHNVQ